MKKTVADFLELVKQWHPTKNGDLKPCDITAGRHVGVWWKCHVADDHEWKAFVYNRTNDKAPTGCPCCSIPVKKIVKSNCLATTHPDIAEQWHPTKNGKLTPYDVVAGCNARVWWKCSVADDHEWQTKVSMRTTTFGNRRSGTNCPCCSGHKTVVSNCLATTHPHLIPQWHPTKNGALTPWNVSKGSTKKVWWKCPAVEDHEWLISIDQRTGNKNSGCSCCAGYTIVKSNCLATTHPDIAKQWHPTKNGALTPWNVSKGSTKKVWWKCPADDHHEWDARIDHRTSMHADCPHCSQSRGEKVIADWLTFNLIKYEPQYRFKKSSIPRSRFDFAVNKGVIEFHGEQHYRPCSFGSKKKDADVIALFKTMKRDWLKETWCKKHNVPMLVIPYWDFDRIPDILAGFFNSELYTPPEPPAVVIKYGLMRQKIMERIAAANADPVF